MDSRPSKASPQQASSLSVVVNPRGGLLHRSRQPFTVLERAVDFFIAQYLARRARRNLAAGFPPLAAFAFDYIGREIALRGQFERDELAVLTDFLKPLALRFADATALDIGANIGNHSLFLAPMFRHVHAFEPNPRTFGVLSVNAKLVNNITAHNIGLGARRQMLSLSFDPLNVGEASLVPRDRDAKQASSNVSVQVDLLDNLVAELGTVALIKIDVEGFEPQVLYGAAHFLRDQRPVIVFEQNYSAFSDGDSETAAVLQAAGYALCVMSKRYVSSKLPGQVLGAVRKMFSGSAYDVIAVDHLPPGNYPMVVAVDPADLALLTRP